jgi:outer membrane protein, multidrug efflux system
MMLFQGIGRRQHWTVRGLACLRVAGQSAALTGCLLSASGCLTVGPNYRGPPSSAVVNAPAARGAFISASSSAFLQRPPPNTWWRLYESPSLDELVNKALRTNADLKVAKANLERSAALVREARSLRQPFAEVDLDPSYQQLSAESYLYPAALPRIGLYDMGISVSYEIDLFGRLRRGIEAARADDEAVKAAYDLARINVIAETTGAYAQVCNTGEELAVARHLLQLQAQSTQTTRRLFDAGLAPRLDFTRSAELAAQISATIPLLEAERRNALFRLAALMGRTPSQYPRSVESCAEAPRLRHALPIGNVTELLRRRPDVREAERVLAAATARIGVAIADLYPRITLGLSAGSTGALSDILTSRTNRYGVGLGVHWQANHSIVRARIAEASAAAKGALAQFDSVVLAALRDTESALTAYSRDRERDADLATAETRAHQAQEEADELYTSGKIGFLPLLDAQRTFVSAEAASVASHGILATDEVTVFLELGGGW